MTVGTERAFYIFFPVLALLAPLANFIAYHHYTVFTAETLLLAACFALIGIPIGVVMAYSHWIIRAVILAFLTAMYADIQLQKNIPEFVLAFCFVLIVASLLRAKLGIISFTVFLVLLVSSLALPSNGRPLENIRQLGQKEINTDLPPIIHIALDEYIGLEGIPEDIQGGPELKELLARSHESYGFRVYGGAYTNYADTYNSIGNMFAFTAESIDSKYVDYERQPMVLLENDYFKILQNQGYQFSVYQSGYMDFCNTPGITVSSCYAYSHNTIKELEYSPLDTEQRAAAIAISYLNMSVVYRGARHFYKRKLYPRALLLDYRLPEWNWDGGRKVGPFFVDRVFDRINKDISEQASGRVFFAHLLFPHTPYIYDEQCRLYTSATERLASETAGVAPRPAVNTPETRENAYVSYFKQIKCLQSKLEALFEHMKSEGIYDDAIIILHGDHGSRISINKARSNNAESFTREDYIDNYSTFFAGKSKFLSTGYESAMLPIVSLLPESLGLSEFSDGIPGSNMLVYFRGARGGQMLMKPLVAF